MRILMTGCATSLGAFVRSRLLEQGHRVYGVGLHGPEFPADFERPNFHGVLVDAFDSALREMGGVDVLVNNAGVTHMDWFEHHSAGDFERVLRVNLVAPFILMQKFVRHIDQGAVSQDPDGLFRVVNTASMATTMALRTSPGYCASKSGLEAVGRVLAKESASRRRLVVITISPGGIEGTAMMERQVISELMRTRGMTKDEAMAYSRQSPLGRNSTMEEVWRLFDWAINRSPEFCSGENFRMPGGMGLL